MIDINYSKLSLSKQCHLAGVAHSNYYYQSVKDNSRDIILMHKIDEIYTKAPYYGVRRMVQSLQQQDTKVGCKLVRRLMRQMGLCALYPKPRISSRATQHRIYPYLLKGLSIDHANQVWCADITYIRLHWAYAFLIAIMDWYSRYVISWALSSNLESDFCCQALSAALAKSQPEIFNSDQGVQFTCNNFIERLQSAGVSISMDGRGRFYDNIVIERLWRTVKYEEVYLKDYADATEASTSLANYFEFYNQHRLHQALGYCPPVKFYYGEVNSN